ncbi:MAG TPA: N-acetylmuramoyl-L-alanine amidase [Actinomycetota bacterium]|nr:N-acetylmuramoyl-L-alanine amidase [Actinomycetota bacterium]
MRRPLLAFLAALAAAVVVPTALAEPGSAPSITAVDLPVAGQRALASRTTVRRFTLVGIHWRGSGSVRFRTRSVAGKWSAWRAAAPEADDAPDLGSAERRRTAGWRIGSPWWVGASDRIETRTLGRVSRVRAFLVWSPDESVAYRAPAAPGAPPIVPRSSWGADESIRRAPPSYAPALRFAIVHHTAGLNDYTRAQAPAVVRAIELYHVQGNGWNDIGYNFLVDRFGTIYEGRYGGIDRNVIGAHALGFNTGSVGIALLGTYGSKAPATAAESALARLLAWRLDLAHVNPLGLLTVISGGSERYPKGVPVTLRAVSGHRDTGYTECPGNALYSRLDAVAAAAATYGGPKIYSPSVTLDEVGARFRATLSAALPWVVSIADSTGAEIARGTGKGAAVDWSWDASSVPPGTYTWSIRAGSARPATGKLKAGSAVPTAPLAIQDAAADPGAISPNGDQQADVSLVSFSLTAPAVVTVQLESEEGAVVGTIVDGGSMGAGLQQVVVDGTPYPDGRYLVAVLARTPTGLAVQTTLPFAISRTLGTVSATSDLVSPNGDGRADQLAIGFSLANPAQVRIRILREGRWVATPFSASLPSGPQRFVWDGSRAGGAAVRDGSYTAAVDVTDAVGTLSYAVPFVVDTTPPTVRILSGARLRVAVSEPALLVVTVDGTVVRRRVKHAGVVTVAWPRPFRRVRVVAWDAAGNASVPAVRVANRGSREPGQ